MSALLVLALFSFIGFVGFFAGEMGYTTPIIDDVEVSGGWSLILVPVNTFASFVQVLTFQVEEMPVWFNTLVFMPVAFCVGWGILRAIRGGG